MPYISGRQSHKKAPSRSGEARARRRACPGRAGRGASGDIDLIKLKKAYTELAAAHHEIRETTIEMMMKMALAAEYKDANTGSHLVRISDYATEVARTIGLSHDEIDVLRYASPMHDVGKIGIPDVSFKSRQAHRRRMGDHEDAHRDRRAAFRGRPFTIAAS